MNRELRRRVDQRNDSRGRAASIAIAALFFGSGCGAGKLVQPKDPTYAGAIGADPANAAICHDVSAEGAPLIIDWRPEDRGDLEAAMKGGVAFVHYDCSSIKVLPDCRLKGDYGYVGVTLKEQVVSLANADEVKANLPFSGGSLGGQVQSGSSLDIGLLMVGKSSSSFTEVARDQIAGKCTDATHFVRAATIGAYAMKTSTSGSVGSAASIFGIGASGSSSSDKGTVNRDGDLDACKQADPDATTAPKGCRAVLRVQLVAIGASGGGDVAGLRCPAGTIPKDGKCATSADEAAKKCQSKDEAACTASCRGGNVESCIQWSDIEIGKALGQNSTAYDAQIAESFKRGCDLKNDEMCAMFATTLAQGRGVPKDGAKALALAESACRAGAAVGCTIVAGMFDRGLGVTADRAKGTRLYERACKAGSGLGCIGAAQAFGDGRPGIAVDRSRMAYYSGRGCDAGESFGCLNAGKSFEAGDGVTANPRAALAFYKRGCAKKNAAACTAEKRLAGR